MARISVTFTVIFFLFAVSHARNPLDVSDNHVDIHGTPAALPESDDKIMIRLPSEIPHSESDIVFELPLEIVEQEDVETETIVAKPIEDFVERGVESVDESDIEHPLTMLEFHPNNLNFPRTIRDLRSPYLPRRPCRHHHRKHLHDEQLHGEESHELSYGNDMILSKESTHADPMFPGDKGLRFHHRHHHHGEPRHERWNEEMERPFHHHAEDDEDDHEHHNHLHGEQLHGESHELSYGNDMILSKESTNFHPMFHGDTEFEFHHHHHPHHGGPRHERWNKEMKRPHHHHMEDDEEDEHEHMGGGFMKSIRKFLNHHF